MKHKGSNCDYTAERNKFFYDSFLKELSHCDSVNFVNRHPLSDGGVMFAPSELMKRLAALPSPRCWISVDRAIAVVNLIEHGHVFPDKTTANRLRLYRYLHEQYKRYRALYPDMQFKVIMFEIVNSGAPESFVSPMSIPKYIIAHRNAHRKVNKFLKHNNEKKSNEQTNQNHIPHTGHIVDSAVSCSPTSASIADGSIANVPSGDQDNLPDVSRQHITSHHQHIHAPIHDIRDGRKATPSVSRPVDIHNHTKRLNRRHTNVRYIRSQQRIDWLDSLVILQTD